jgi:adenylate cyclase
VPLGHSVLDASRIAGIDHASPCGGRGRCSLCRIRVLTDTELPPVTRSERRILGQIGLDPASVRLACQLRPRNDIAAIPLIPPEAATAFLHRRQRAMAPTERFLVHLFVDMRDSTRFAATHPPHDSVFILGRFIACVSAAVVDAGGQPNQFLGDGILAIFGLRTDPETACNQALRALSGIERNIRQLRELLHEVLRAPLSFGIGLQCGPTLVGEIGFRDHVTVTGLGDPPNVASRLQDLSRELGCEAIAAEDVFQTAGVSAEALPLHVASLRGREQPVPVRLLFSVERDLASLGAPSLKSEPLL